MQVTQKIRIFALSNREGPDEDIIIYGCSAKVQQTKKVNPVYKACRCVLIQMG